MQDFYYLINGWAIGYTIAFVLHYLVCGVFLVVNAFDDWLR